jgi:uncharacterized membrane protein
VVTLSTCYYLYHHFDFRSLFRPKTESDARRNIILSVTLILVLFAFELTWLTSAIFQSFLLVFAIYSAFVMYMLCSSIAYLVNKT